MNYESERVLLHVETLSKVKTILNEIKILSQDKTVRDKVDEILEIVDRGSMNTVNKKEMDGEALIDIIYKKMKKTKDRDLNVKLYMLYRKLEERQISEEEALKLYEIYIKTEYNDIYI